MGQLDGRVHLDGLYPVNFRTLDAQRTFKLHHCPRWPAAVVRADILPPCRSAASKRQADIIFGDGRLRRDGREI